MQARRLRSSWYWPSYPDFTFLIDLTNNDNSIVSNVCVHVRTSAGTEVPLWASYVGGAKDIWVAKAQFHSGALPVNVSVSYTYTNYGQVEARAYHSALEKDYNRVTVSQCTDDEELITYRLTPTDPQLALDCAYLRAPISKKSSVYDRIGNTFFQQVDIAQQGYRYYAYNCGEAYLNVRETSDSIYAFATFIADDATDSFSQFVSVMRGRSTAGARAAERRTWGWGTTEDHVPPSTDWLNQWRDHIIQGAIDEANRKLPCQDEAGAHHHPQCHRAPQAVRRIQSRCMSRLHGRMGLRNDTRLAPHRDGLQRLQRRR